MGEENRDKNFYLKEILMSFVIAMIPALGAVVWYVSSHEDASGGEVGVVGLIALILSTGAIFLIRTRASRKTLKIFGMLFLGCIFAFVLTAAVSTVVICNTVGGEIAQKRRGAGLPLEHDIHGHLVSRRSRKTLTSPLSLVCYIPKEKVESVKSNNSFFYDLTTFISK